jgi:hypothetical protein
VRVADHVEQPDETPGPAAAFVVVDHIDGIVAVAELAEQFLQVAQCRQQAGAGG